MTTRTLKTALYSFAILLVCFQLIAHSQSQTLASWSPYPFEEMYSGQYSAILDSSNTQTAGTVYTFSNQPIYRNSVNESEKYTTIPKVVLSLMGYHQTAPRTVDTPMGFDVQVVNITLADFDVIHNIIGGDLTYLHYMYLTFVRTDYEMEFATIIPTGTSETLIRPYNFGEEYSNFPQQTIGMKGFLVGYSLKQGTANGFFINFTLTAYSSTSYKIQISTDSGSELIFFQFYRLGYDQTAIQRETYNDYFRDAVYELVNNVNTVTFNDQGWTDVSELQYRNYLMGVNKININGTGPIEVEFYLYYFFGQTRNDINFSNPVLTAFFSNPATAEFLQADIFHHAIKECPTTNGSLNEYFLTTDFLCYEECPETGFFTEETSKTCLECHYSCNTCSAPFVQTACIDCNATADRVFVESSNQCVCPFGSADVSPIELCQDEGSTGCVATSNEGIAFKCISCAQGFDLDYEINRCVTSIEFCAEFDESINLCVRCIPSQILISGQCQDRPSNCSKVSEVTGLCEVCEGQLIVEQGLCVVNTSCSENQYRDQFGECLPEPIENCQEFDEFGTCLFCEDDFRFTSDLSLCVPEFEEIECPEPTLTVRYEVNNGQCTPIDTNCAENETFLPTGCTVCKEGFYLFNKVCYPIVEQV